MVDRRIGIAIVAASSLDAGALAQRSGLFRADSRVWQVCLFWAVFGAALLVSVALMQLGFAHALTFATLVLVAVDALSGVLAGLLMASMQRRWPS